MKLRPTSIDGVVIIELEPSTDDRGFFARGFDTEVFERDGLMHEVVHVNLSRNHAAGTLRGLHFQAAPQPDPKVVRCVRGSVFDVAVDVRDGSPTRGQWVGRTLDAQRGDAMHIPGGCAHGFITLEPDSDILYLMGADYAPSLSRGVRWDDPTLGIEWPVAPMVVSPRDAALPNFA